MVYGSLVVSLLETVEDVEEVNRKLEEIGYRVGLRFAHEFAKDKTLEKFETFDSLLEKVVQKYWPMFSNGKGKVTVDRREGAYILHFSQSVFTQNVNIPDMYKGLDYRSALPGVLRGMFEIFHFKAEVSFNSDHDVLVENVEQTPYAVPKDDD